MGKYVGVFAFWGGKDKYSLSFFPLYTYTTTTHFFLYFSPIPLHS